MSTSILATKLFPPILKQELVSRPHLVQLLNDSQKYKLTLISAPPGFGKTTLLSEWLHQKKVNAAWFALDEEDNDPFRFLSYLISAVQQAERTIGESSMGMLNTLQGPSMESVFINFINELSTLKHPLSILLDDYQVIDNIEIQSSMSYFINHLPKDIHLLISSRADPPWKLARLRSERELFEIRSRDLSFSFDETRQFLNSLMALNISPGDISALESRTEGWIASLQMAAISLQKSEDAHAFIKAFTGSNRVIFDYLVEEVLHVQTPEVESFLLKTSIFETFNADMANFVLQSADSRSILADLEKSNLFLIPLDNEHRWFRYHHLFSDLLKVHLLHDDPHGAIELHMRAAEWEEKQGNALGAFHHALSAKDLTGAIRIAENNSLGLLDSGQISDLNSWLNAIPQSIINHSPWLIVARAWVVAYLGKTELVETLLKQAEKQLAEFHNPDQQDRIRGNIATIRAYVSWMLGNPTSAIEFSKAAIELLPEIDTLALSQAYLTMAEGYQNTLQYDASEKAFKKADDYSRHLTNSHLHIFSISFLGFLFYIREQYNRAERQCRELLKEYEQPDGTYKLLSLANPLATLCEIYTDQGKLDEAVHYGEQAIKLARQWQQVDTLHFSLTCLDRAYLFSGKYEQANALLKQSKKLAAETSPWFRRISDTLGAYHNIFQNQPARVQAWLDERHFQPAKDRMEDRLEEFSIYRQLLLLRKEYSKTLDISLKLLDYSEKTGEVVRTISNLGDMAKAYIGLGQLEKANDCVDRMIQLAEPEHIGYPFIIRGTIMRELLKKALSKGICSRFRRNTP